MKKTILEIYALAVCFFAVVMITVNLSMLIYNTVGSINPELTMSSYKYEKHLNNENFKAKNGCNKEELKTLTEDEITKKREAAYAQEVRSEIRSNQQSVLREAIYIFISAVVLLIHIQISKKCRKEPA